ncbi:hypothetical protein AAHC03_022899 [Spirometra sp. Aus1]
MLHSLQPSAWFQVLLALLCLNFFPVIAGGDIGWPNSNRLVLLVHSYPYATEADIYVNWPVESPDRLLSLDASADPEEAVCPQLPRINKTVRTRPEMTLEGLKKNCKYTVTVTVKTHFNEPGLSEVRRISTDETPDEKVNYARTSHKTVSFSVFADKSPSAPCLIALNSGRRCRLVVYNSNINRSEVCTVEASDLCPFAPPPLALTTLILLGERDNRTRVISISLPKKLHDSLQPFDLQVGPTRGSYHVLPPQNIDWVVAPTSKTELSVVLKYRPPATNIDLLKNFTFVILERGAEKERIIVSVGEEVSPQTKDDTISVTTEQVRRSQEDDSVFLSVALRSRLAQGKQHELRVFTNGDEVGQATFTLTPPTFDPVRFWQTSVKSVKSEAITLRWPTPIFGDEGFSWVVLKAKTAVGGSQESLIHATTHLGDLEGLQPWTNYSISITAVYSHGSYEKEMGVYRTAVDAPPAPDIVKAVVTGPGIINASWSPVTVFRGKEVYYKAACDTIDWQFFNPPGRLTAHSAVFGRLTDCTQYKCRVMAVAVGDGTQEAKSKLAYSDTVRTWPPRPSKIRVSYALQFTTQGVTIAWERASARCSVLSYTLEVRLVQQPQSVVLEAKYPSNTTKALISGLPANTHCEARVRYEVLPDADGNGGGIGEFSDPEQFWTWPQAPTPPKDVTANAVNSSAIHVSWSPPDRPGGILAAYTVYINFLLPDGTAVSRNKIVSDQESDLLVGELPSGTIIKVAVRASTKSSVRNEGGGLGEASPEVFIRTAADSSKPLEATRGSSTHVVSTKSAMMTPSTAQFSTPG